jgi:hypothetical protein
MSISKSQHLVARSREAPSRQVNRGRCDGQPGSMVYGEWEEPDGASHAVLLGV